MHSNKPKPLVSIRIPAYNHEKYVFKTLDSVLEQGYQNIEIIIIDDASSDNTWKEIQRWINEKGDSVDVFSVRHSENKGIASTINELISLCNGKYIAGIASDDYLLPGSIESRVNYLETHELKDAVFADCKVIDDEGNELFESGLSELYSMRKDKLLNEKTILWELVSNWGVPGGTLMIRNQVKSYLKLNEKLLVEDFDFFLKLLAKKKLGFIDTKISAYRLHHSNVSNSEAFSVKRKLDFIKTISGNFFRFTFFEKLILLTSIGIRFIRSVGSYNKSITEKRS